MGLVEELKRQFDHPHGWPGRLAGWWMALTGQQINRWTVANLEIAPEDHVLEIGCGPGIGLREAARLCRLGKLAGVDPAPVMLAQAKTRNRALVDQQRLELRLAAVSALPFNDNSFDRAFSVNNYDLWRSPVDDLKEIHRVLKKGGLLAVTLQPRWARSIASADALGAEIQDQFSSVGFKEVRVLRLETSRVPTLCVAGIKPLHNGSLQKGDPTSLEWLTWDVLYQRERIPAGWH